MKKILLVFILTFQSTWALEGIRFDHGNWTLACDNTGTCRAAGYHDETEDRPVSVLLTRKAGDNAPITARVALLTEFGEGPVNNFRLSINGKDLGSVAPINQTDFSALLTAKQTQALVSSLKKDSSITFSKGDMQWHLSDVGASAVLLKMDDFQQRIGTPSAIMRKGNSKKTVLEPQQPPIIKKINTPKDEGQSIKYKDHPMLFTQLEKYFSNPDESDNDTCDLELLKDGGSTYTLNSDTKLLEFGCWRGAYNWGSLYALLDNQLTLKKLLPVMGDGYADGEIAGNWKNRGIGDCWVLNNYVWTGKGFIHNYQANSGLCRGFGGGAWQLPTFVSRVISGKQKK